jgi:hypothetical protein
MSLGMYAQPIRFASAHVFVAYGVARTRTGHARPRMPLSMLPVPLDESKRGTPYLKLIPLP